MIALLFLLFLSSSYLEARQLFTPQTLRRGPINKPFTDISRDCWTANLWGGYYHRSAHKAFNCSGHETNLATLIFNKPCFNAQEAFAQSMATSITNPLLATSILGPRVSYKEKGVMLGIDLQKYLTACWRVGFRSSLPVAKRQIRRLKGRGNGSSILGGQTTQDVTTERIENVDGAEVIGYAYRLDFLSRLPYTCNDCPARNFLIVNYNDPDFPPFDPITISNQDITDQNGNPVSALDSASGRLPQGQLAIPQSEAQMLPILNASGNNLSDGGRGRFSQTVIYTDLGNSPQNQSHLFIVPSVANGKTVASAGIIQQQVRELLACIAPSAETIFTDCGISFDSQCVKGIGDLDTEIYGGYLFSPCLYGELFAGIVVPTGKRAHNAQRPFRQSIGNNGHYEYKIGGQALWQPHTLFCFKSDVNWFWIQHSEECVASSFVGATVKNLGVPIQASISWDAVVFHADIVISPQWKYCGGLTFGYELYHKSRDVINFCASFITDCLGANQPLDSRVLSRTTNVTSHKLRGELFANPREWLQLFGGGSRVIGGKNTPKESEWYLGLSLYF